jgi:hypothetical protein
MSCMQASQASRQGPASAHSWQEKQSPVSSHWLVPVALLTLVLGPWLVEV